MLNKIIAVLALVSTVAIAKPATEKTLPPVVVTAKRETPHNPKLKLAKKKDHSNKVVVAKKKQR
jgi:hypothetical protein